MTSLSPQTSPQPSLSRIRIGSAPDSWGVWFPDDPQQVPWQRFLDEVSQSGYEWIELGPYGYLPTDPAVLEAETARRGLNVSAGTVFTGLHRGPEVWDATWAHVSDIATLTQAMGAEHLVVIPAFWRDDKKLDVELFAIVEQDMYPCPPDKPLPIAQRTRAFLRSCGT